MWSAVLAPDFTVRTDCCEFVDPLNPVPPITYVASEFRAEPPEVDLHAILARVGNPDTVHVNVASVPFSTSLFVTVTAGENQKSPNLK